jgi:hypothetical protein
LCGGTLIVRTFRALSFDQEHGLAELLELCLK